MAKLYTYINLLTKIRPINNSDWFLGYLATLLQQPRLYSVERGRYGFGRRRQWPVWRHYLCIHLETEKNMKMSATIPGTLVEIRTVYPLHTSPELNQIKRINYYFSDW